MANKPTCRISREKRELAELKRTGQPVLESAEAAIPRLGSAPAGMTLAGGIVIGKTARLYLESVQRRLTRRMGKKMNRVTNPFKNKLRKPGR